MSVLVEVTEEPDVVVEVRTDVAPQSGGSGGAGLLDVREVPDAFGNVAVFDGVTPSGLAVRSAALYAHAHKLKLVMPGGDLVLTDPDGAPVLTRFDFNAHPWGVEWCGIGNGTTLNVPGLLGLALDPNDLALCGDPGGRVANFLIDGVGMNKASGAYYLHDFAVMGHHATNFGDPEDIERGWAVRMGGRALCERLSIGNFHAAFVYRPRIGAGHRDNQIDHNTSRKNSHAGGCAHFYFWSYQCSRSGLGPGDGDHVIDDGDASAVSHSSFTCDPAGVTFDSKITSIHKGAAPYSFSKQAGPKGPKTLATGATVERDIDGVVTVKTLMGTTPSTQWPGEFVPPAFGFRLGDCVELAGLNLALSDVSGGGNDDLAMIGMVSSAVDESGALVVTMEHPIPGVIAPAVVAGLTIQHHYNTTRWLDSNVDHDGTDEGSATSFMRSLDGTDEIRGYPRASVFVMHGNEAIGRNGGKQQAYSPVPVLQVERVNQTHPGFTAVDGDVMLVTVKLAAGTPVNLYDTIFLNTPDDNPPHPGWQPNPDRCRGKWRVNSVDDDGTRRLFTYLQVASAKRGTFYTEKTLGDGTTPGSAGTLGRLSGIVAGNWLDMKVGLDIQHEAQSGSGPSEIEIVLGGQLRRSACEMVGGRITVVPNVKNLPGTTDVGASEPVRSRFEIGTLSAAVDHNVEDVGGPTAGLIVPGHVLERTSHTDVQLYRGGPFAGVALYLRQNGSYLPYATKGEIRGAEYGIDYPADPDDTTRNHGGVVSRAAFNIDDILAGDPTDPGMARLALATDTGTMRAMAGSTGPRNVGPLTNVWVTAVELLETPVAPTAMNQVQVVFAKADTLAVTVGHNRYTLTDAASIDSVLATVGTAPVGSSVIIDVKKNGVSIFTTPSHRPIILAGTNEDQSPTPDITALVPGDFLTVDIVQVGSTIPGADLTVQILLVRQ